MSDRRAQPYPPSANVNLASQWSSTGQYPANYASQDHYSSYQGHPSLRTTSHPPPPVAPYDAMSAQAQAIAAQYHIADSQIHYSHLPTSDRRSSISSMSQYGAYSVDSHHGSPGAVAPRSHSHSQSYSHSSSHALPHSPTHSHAYAQQQAMAAHSYGAPLSSSPQSSPAMSNMATAQYGSQAAYSQGPVSPSQYPASPPRPFACDLCALSFNRQHDLKRHRDTHTGEKPFFCNGGCGKTFTRKDALKRHQVRGTIFVFVVPALTGHSSSSSGVASKRAARDLPRRIISLYVFRLMCGRWRRKLTAISQNIHSLISGTRLSLHPRVLTYVMRHLCLRCIGTLSL